MLHNEASKIDANHQSVSSHSQVDEIYVLHDGNAALSMTAGRTAAASSGAVRREVHPLRTWGPHVSPTAVSCMTQVQSNMVVAARTIQSFIRDRAADDDGAGARHTHHASSTNALPPPAVRALAQGAVAAGDRADERRHVGGVEA